MKEWEFIVGIVWEDMGEKINIIIYYLKLFGGLVLVLDIIILYIMIFLYLLKNKFNCNKSKWGFFRGLVW